MVEYCELTDYELGYISGMVDGEGWVGIQKYKGKGCKNYSYQAICMISNTDRNALEFMRFICGGGSIAEQKRREKTHRILYRLWFPKYIIEKILPYLDLIIKRKQQELLTEALSMMKGSGYIHTDSERARIEEIYQDLKKLNKRGR